MASKPNTQNRKPILYSFRRCPYAMRGRMGLYYAGIICELREVVLRDKPQEMLDISPKGTVPVLQLSDSSILEESLDIMRWALDQSDPDGWLDNDVNEINNLITENDGPFKKALDRYKYPGRYPDEDCSDARNQGEAFLKQLNERLEKNNYLIANKISLADITIFPFIRQFANTDRDWFDRLPYNKLQQWLEAHLQSDLFQAIMPKYDQWHKEKPPVMFGRL